MFGFEIEIEQFRQLHHYNDTYCFEAQPLYHLESKRFEPRVYIKLILPLKRLTTQPFVFSS